MQRGGAEYLYAKEWLGIYWPADEYMYIKLVSENRLDSFYEEAGRLLTGMIKQSWPLLDGAVKEAIKVNAALVSRPFIRDDMTIATKYNVPEFCDALRKGTPVPLREVSSHIEIIRSKSYYEDIEDWCREVVWWGNKKGAYLYINRLAPVDPQLAGHY
jgi:hypothetical protein